MNRHEAREEIFFMLYEREFQPEKSNEEIFTDAQDAREASTDTFVTEMMTGIAEHKEEIDALMMEHANGWKRERITKSAVVAMTICIYEMYFRDDIPTKVSLNEAIELVKKYDDEKAKAFVNGVLHALSAKAPEKSV